MNTFVDATLDLPAAVLFSFPLLVVAAYWVLVLLGASRVGVLDARPAAAATGGDPDDDRGVVGLLAGLGLGGLPATVVLSMFTVIAWVVCVAGDVLVARLHAWPPLHGALSGIVLIAALVGAWFGTRAVVVPLRRFARNGAAAARAGFVGGLCVIESWRVGPDCGRAEVTAPDGGSVRVQVRTIGTAEAATGWTALIYEYDESRDLFWVTLVDRPAEVGSPPALV